MRIALLKSLRGVNIRPYTYLDCKDTVLCVIFLVTDFRHALQMILINESRPTTRRKWCVTTRIGVCTDRARPSFRRKTLTRTCVRI